MAVNGPNLRALLPQQRLDHTPLMKGLENSSIEGVNRQFAGVHNLHQNDGFRAAFSRVQPKAAQVKAYVGKGLNKIATFKPENGIPVAKLKVSTHEPGEVISASQAARNHRKVQAGYESLNRQLRHLEPPPGQQQKGFFHAIRRLFGLDKPQASLSFKVERDDQPPKQAPANLGAGAAADAPPAAAAAGKIKLTISSGDKPELAQKAGEPVSFTAQDAKLYESKVGLRKAAWLGAAGLGVGAAVTLAIFAAIPGMIVGGVVVGGILLKAAFGKSPWWGKTAEGQMQKSARQEARHAADGIAQMVKNQVLCDTTEHNLPGPEGGFLKQSILSDKNMLTDFVALARQDKAKDLSKRVRQFVLSNDSPLPKEVRDLAGLNLAKRSLQRLRSAFQGDPVGHARKTVDLMTQEITRGIMQGVQEGVLQSVVLDLSNELSNAAREELYKIPLPRLAQFQTAVARLYPSANDSRHPIHQPDDTLKDLRAFQNGTTQQLLKQLQDKAETIGPDNLKSYSDMLRKLDGDVSTHIASMVQIQALVGSPDDDDPPLNTLANLQGRLAEIAGGRLDGPDIDVAKTAIDQQIANLRQRITSANEPSTDQLVQAHAQQFLSLLDAMGQAAQQSVDAASQLAGIRADFSRADLPPTLEMVRKHQASLAKLGENYIDPAQGNPTDSQAIVAAQAQGQHEATRLLDLCHEISKAAQAADTVESTMNDSLALARQGQLKNALAPDLLRSVDDQCFAQKMPLLRWKEAGFVQPGDLKAYSDADLQALRSQACGLAIGLDAGQAKDLQPVLLALSQGDQDGLITGLRKEAEPNMAALLGSLRTLQEQLPKNTDTPQQADGKALRSFQALTELRLFNGQLEPCQELVQSLHPNQLTALNKYQAVHAIEQNLRLLFAGERGEKLYAWGEKQGKVAPNGRVNFGFDPKRTLELLQAFSDKPGAQAGSAQARLKAITEAWPAQEKVQDWSVDPQRLRALDPTDLEQVRDQLKSLASGFDSHVRSEQLKAKVMARQMAGKIVAGGQGSSDPKVQAAVLQASSAKDPAQAQQLQQQAQDLRLLQQDQEDAERQQRLDQGQITKLSAFLKDKLAYKGSAEQLAQRIAENHELSAEFMLLIDTGVKLAGAEAPPLLQPSFTPEQLLAGADELASYVAHKYVDSLPPPLQPMVAQRNAMIGKIKSTEPGQARARLVAKDPKVRAYLEAFLNEEFAYQLLAHNVDLKGTKKSVRIILDNTADPTERAQLNVEMTRQSTLTPANLKKIQDGLRVGLKKQQEALATLQEGAEQHFGPAMSTYMADQRDFLLAQMQAAERLPQAYDNPQTGDLALMGQLLRQADGLKDKTQIQIQRAYIKGQNQASQDALKYFDIRRFDASRPGFFGRLIFSVMRKGQPLKRLLRSAADEKNALGKAIADLTRARASEQISKEQLALFENRIQALQTAKDAITGDPGKVEQALLMLAQEHLAGKQGSNPRITEADLQTILGQWKSMLAGASRDCFPEIEQRAPNLLLDKSVSDLETSLSDADKAQLALDLGQLMREQDALVVEHQDLRAQLNKIDLQTHKPDPRVLRLYQAGLDASDQAGVEALESRLAQLAGKRTDLIAGWKAAGDLLAKSPASALHRAGKELRSLDRALASPGGLTANEQKQLRLLKDQLEDAFLARMGPSAPLRLERSAASDTATVINTKAQDLKIQVDKFPDVKNLQAWFKSQDASQQSSLRMLLDGLRDLDIDLRAQLLAHPIEQLAASQAPRSLNALAQLASARLTLGLIYSRLSAATGDPSPIQAQAAELLPKAILDKKADSHLYGGLFMQQELRNPSKRWAPDPKAAPISGLPSDEASIKNLRSGCEKASQAIDRGQPLTAAKADALDDAAEDRLDQAMMKSHLDDSLNLDSDDEDAPKNSMLFNAVISQ